MAKDPTLETLERVRRIEMRLTLLMEAQNIETGVYRPTWQNGTIIVPSRMSSLNDVLRVVPGNWPKDHEIILVMKNEIIGKLKAA
jgi:hypothetical protein